MMTRLMATLPLLLIVFCGGDLPSQQPIPTSAPGQPVVLDEYADFACPYCARFARLALPQIEADFAQELANGRLVYQFRHFPILGDWSWAAAAGAVCAGEQGLFREYHDAVFGATEQEAAPQLAEIAEQAGLDEAQLSQCLANPETHQAVDRDAEEAIELGIRGTPTLALNGQPIQWDSYAHLKAILTEALNQ